jgi:hypothetical protein
LLHCRQVVGLAAVLGRLQQEETEEAQTVLSKLMAATAGPVAVRLEEAMPGLTEDLALSDQEAMVGLQQLAVLTVLLVS